jgi:DNA modification methylase
MNKDNLIYNEDCIETLSKMDSESIDLIFADPPFNVGLKYQGFKDNNENYFEWSREWISECFRVLKPTGSFYLMTLDKNLAGTLPIMEDHGVFINIIKWKNVSSGSSKKTFWPSSQPIILYGKTKDYIFNTFAEKNNGFKCWDKNRESKGQLLDYWDDIPLVYAGSIKHKEAIIEPGTNKKAHIAQMPEHLVGRAIKFSTNEGDLVFDPFMGSGTTAAACKKLKRNFIGSEISKYYYDLSNKRLNQIIELF